MRQEQHKILSPGLTLQVFYSIYAKRKLGVVVTGILLAANYIFINAFLYESLINPIDYPYSIFDYIQVITRYFYMVNYLDILPVAYSILRYIPAAFNLSYLALFLRMRILIKNKRQDRVNERIFEICNTYYAHILMLPLYDIMYRDLFCDQTVMTYYQQQCLVGGQIITFVFSMFGLVSGLIMTALTVIYNLNGIYDKKNYLSGQNRIWEIMQAFIKVIIPLIAVNNKNNNHTYFIVYIVINLIFALILLAYFMAFFPLNKLYSEAFTLVGLTLYLAQSAAHLAFIGSKNDAINPTYLGVFFWPTILAGSYFFYNKLKTRLVMKTHASSSAELIRQVQAILQLKKNEKILSDDEVYYRGLIIRHKASCINLKCFCKSDELFDPKKGKDFEPTKWTNLKNLILKYYVRFLFEQAIESGGSDTELIISYAEFLFQKFRNTHLALFHITQLINADKFIYPYYRFRIYKLQQKISSYIDARNLEALDKPLEIENVILIEEQLEKVIHGMKKIIMTSLGFWSYLYNKDIELEKLKTLAEEMHYSVENTTKAWGPLKPYLYKQRRIMYYYNWFLKDILQKKIILSEEEVDDLFDSDVASVYSADFLNILKDDNVIFQDDTAIVHMSGNSNQIGRILKTNRAANKLFKYSPQELNRSSVDILMPNMIAHKHNFYINSFVITGKSKVLYQQKRTFGKDKQGYIMPLWILVKQLNSPMGDVQYVGLLRPLSQKKDEHNYYMLLNNFGEINPLQTEYILKILTHNPFFKTHQRSRILALRKFLFDAQGVNGITKSLAELLHLPPDLFQKIDVNVILLAPKLIKHFFFARVLTSEKAHTQNASSVAFGGPSGTNINSFASGGFGKKSGRFSGKISPFMGSIAQKSPLKVFHELDKMYEDVTEVHDEEGVEKPESESDLSFEEAQDLIDNKSGGVEVEFTLRIPKKLRAFLKEFNALKSRHHELLNNQQFLVSAIHRKSIGINSMMSEGGPPSSAGGTARKKLKMVGHFTNFKHAIDAYISALQHTAEKISKIGVNNVYRIRGVVVTDYYGPDRDVVKYIKIVEVVKKIEKFSHMLESTTRSGTSKRTSEVSDLNKSYGSFHASQTMRSQKKTPKSSFRPERPIEDIQVKSDEDEGAKIYMKSEENVEDSPRAAEKYSAHASSRGNIRERESLSMKEVRSKSEKEPEDSDEEKDDGGSNESEDRQAIMNELKNNILTHYQSIYQKEDNMMIDRNFRSLNNVKWFIVVLFLMLVPLNIIIYLVGPFTTYKQLKRSVNNIYLNEDIRRNYMRCHNSFISIILNNEGTFDSLTSSNTDAYEYFNTYPSERLATAYEDLISESATDEWMIILYQYAPEVTQTTSVDYQGAFEGATVTVSHAVRRLQQTVQTIEAYTKSQYVRDDEDLTFFRVNSMEKFNKILGDATREIFESIDDKFNSTENLSIIILVVEGLLFFFSFWIILRLILIVIRSLRESLAIFAAIDNKQIMETENYYKRLLEYLEVSNKQYITLDNGQGANSILTKKEEDLIKSTRRREEKKEGAGKKFKNIHSGRFMRNDTIKILSFYLISILLCFALSGLFHLMNKLNIDSIQSALTDSQKFIELSPTYVTTLVALKELQYSSTEYKTYVLPYISDVLDEVSTVLGASGYSSSLNFIQDTYMNVLRGNPCESFREYMENTQQYEDCNNLGFGGLASGLLSFHNYYKDIVSGTLAMTDSADYGEVEIEELYTYGQLIRIIDDIIMEKLLIWWKQDMDTYVASKEELIAVLIAIVSVLNVVVYFGARSGVVGTLQNRFLFYRKIYNEYMLAEAPVKEKRIKAVLVKYKLLNR